MRQWPNLKDFTFDSSVVGDLENVEPLPRIAALHVRFSSTGAAVKLVRAVPALFPDLLKLVICIRDKSSCPEEEELNKVDQALAEVRAQMPNVSTTRY